MAIQLYPRIAADVGILSGQPVIEGTSVPVSVIVLEVAAGGSLHDIAQKHVLTVEDVQAALEYAAQRASEPVVSQGAEASAADEAHRLGLDSNHLSPLGSRLLELRAQAFAAGEPLLATWEALDAEIAERRGGVYPDVGA